MNSNWNAMITGSNWSTDADFWCFSGYILGMLVGLRLNGLRLKVVGERCALPCCLGLLLHGVGSSLICSAYIFIGLRC